MMTADKAMKLAGKIFNGFSGRRDDDPIGSDVVLKIVRSLESDGWVCVPKVATAEMFFAWVRNTPGGSEYTGGPDFTSGWDAAIRAAPRLTGEKR